MKAVIEITFKEVLYNIDALTHKAMDIKGENPDNPLAPYHIRTDDNTLDRSVLLRMMNRRDAKVRLLLQAYLIPEDSMYKENEEPDKEDSYVYRLCMPEAWPRALLKPLTALIHDYIVRGVVYNYYTDFAPELARYFDFDASEMEEEIGGITKRRTGAVRRPLYPI